AGASILALGYLLPMAYLTWSMRYGKVAGPNPWPATGLEWKTDSPPPTENFEVTPEVTWEPYDYKNRPDLGLTDGAPSPAPANGDDEGWDFCVGSNFSPPCRWPKPGHRSS